MKKFIKIIGILVFGAFCIIGVYFFKNYQIIPKTSKEISSCEIKENNVTEFINEIRSAKNIPLVTVDCDLNNLAKIRAVFLFENQQWSHEKFSEAIQSLEVRFSKRAEILARNYFDKEAVKAWIESDNHRQFLLDKDYKYIGVGKSGNIIVVWFID